MALKNLFDMVKADRYTADGREELIKAQKAETEDKVYQIGEISQKTGLQKTANGWVKPKNGKQPGAKQEEPKNVHGAEVDKIYERQLKRIKELKAKGFTDEQIDNDKIIKQTKEDMKNVGKKPESKPGRDRPALKKEDHVKLAKEVLSNTSATDPGWTAEEIAKEWKLGKADAEEVKKEFDNLRKGSSGNKPAAPVKRNEAEKVKHSDGTESYRIKGTQFYFNTPEEAENAILAKNRGGTTYARPSQDPTVNNIQESLGFSLDTPYGGKHSMDDFMKKTGENEYAANVWAFGTDSKGTLINPLSETDKPNATIKKENGEWKLHYKGRDGKETVVTANGRQDPTRDAAPRVLTGDTRIRVRKA